MFEFLYERIKNNLWLHLFLLLGTILAVAIFSAIPMYSSAMLQRLLIKDLEIMQEETGIHAGKYSVERTYLGSSDQGNIDLMEAQVVDKLYAPMPLDYFLESRVYRSNNYQIWSMNQAMIHQNAIFITITDLENHLVVTSGRLPESREDGVIEVLMTQSALEHFDLAFEGQYYLRYGNQMQVQILVVGIFENKDATDPYFGDGQLDEMNRCLTVLPKQFDQINSLVPSFHIASIKWNRFYDYHALSMKVVPDLIEAGQKFDRAIGSLGDGYKMTFNMLGTLADYESREKVLRVTLWILTVPVLIITAFYIYMISLLIVEHDGVEIAMLKSRGAGTGQIFGLYVIQSFGMSLIAFIIGPFVGYLICRLIGASNGFLAFVQRSGLKLVLDQTVFTYGGVAALVFMIFMLIPAFMACHVSIVAYKRKKNGKSKGSLWEKIFLDLILIGVSAYGYFNFTKTANYISEDVQAGGKLDPMLFMVPMFFVIGMALLFVRLYPYLIRMIYFLGKKRWRPVLYYSLLNAHRADPMSKFIGLFIVLFLSFGLLSASQARTLNQNAMDRIEYRHGVDVQIKPYIEEEELTQYWSDFVESFDTSNSNIVLADKVPYSKYQQLEGVLDATKVLVRDDVYLHNDVVKIDNVSLLGIVPYEFAKMSWTRSDLLDHHLIDYMNIMTEYPTAIFLSKQAAEGQNIQIGDSVELIWDKYALAATVFGFIDYFPTYNPYDTQGLAYQNIIIANFDYIEGKLPVQKYEIWLNKKEGVSDQEILNQLGQNNLEIDRVIFRDQALVKQSNDPMLQGTNGVLTMGYVIMLLITLVGYLIYWILSIKSRALKFGIFRAMGLGMWQVTGIIVAEQVIMISGALVAGFGIGTVAARVFVPMLQKFDVASAQIPPFIVVIRQGDYLNILGITIAILILVMLVQTSMVNRLKVNQVIKLGED